METVINQEWMPYLQRYHRGEWRAPIFRDMVLADARKRADQPGGLAVLDIGCGGGFDSDENLQHSIAGIAGQYIGVEPDTEIPAGACFNQVHRCYFEDAPITPGSIDIAFAVMVLEHFEHPEIFWKKIYQVLRPGGVFWGFTVDARHWFVTASVLSERLGIKDLYLNLLHGKRGEERYENYGVFYRSNTPDQIGAMTGAFTHVTTLNFRRVGQADFYIPKPLRWLNRAIDSYAIRRGRPGSILAVRAEK